MFAERADGALVCGWSSNELSGSGRKYDVSYLLLRNMIVGKEEKEDARYIYAADGLDETGHRQR